MYVPKWISLNACLLKVSSCSGRLCSFTGLVLVSVYISIFVWGGSQRIVDSRRFSTPRPTESKKQRSWPQPRHLGSPFCSQFHHGNLEIPQRSSPQLQRRRHATHQLHGSRGNHARLSLQSRSSPTVRPTLLQRNLNQSPKKISLCPSSMASRHKGNPASTTGNAKPC